MPSSPTFANHFKWAARKDCKGKGFLVWSILVRTPRFLGWLHQVVLSSRNFFPPRMFIHLSFPPLPPFALYEFFTHHASCTLQVPQPGRWPPPSQTSWSSCWASWWRKETCFTRWEMENWALHQVSVNDLVSSYQCLFLSCCNCIKTVPERDVG